MTADEVKAMVASGESETLEFKSTTKLRREATRTVCAMLNQRGGQVLFGVNPKGHVHGQQVSDRTIEELSAELRRIDPPAFPSVERVPVTPDRAVIMVRVSSGAAKPYRYLGEAYRRVGNATVAMSAEEYNRMLFERMHSEQRWENQPAVGWTVKDLDESEILRALEEAIRRGRQDDPRTREPMDLLRGAGLLVDGDLSRAAVVLFGKRERIEADMTQCLLRVARFKGLDRSEFLDNRRFRGNAFTLLSAAERFLRDNNPVASRFQADRFERIDEPLYPPLAVREALANALCHRDYSLGADQWVWPSMTTAWKLRLRGPSILASRPQCCSSPTNPCPGTLSSPTPSTDGALSRCGGAAFTKCQKRRLPGVYRHRR